MKLLVDAHMVGERETGNETYMANLVRGLAALNADHEIYVAAAHPEAVAPLVSGSRKVTVARVSANPFRRLLIDLPALAKRLTPDLVCSTYAGPVTVRCPIVVAVHDVSFRRHPEWFSARDRLVLNAGVGMTIRRAAAVITLSEFSKREIETLYPAAASRVSVIPLAPGPTFTPDGRNDDEVQRRCGIRRPYVLAVGNLSPRKNLLRLVEAFSRLAERPDFVHDLVLVGSAGRQGARINELIQRRHLTDRVRTTGYVSTTDLPALYRGADLFVYPSLYEGFGLPILEAMACGTPVLASNVASMPDVAGAAARLVDPLSVEALAQGVADLCASAEERARWREKGLAHSRTFTWEQVARRTLDVFRGVSNGSGPTRPRT